MEQKKILWIITASGVFLTVVILGALIVVKTKSSIVPSKAGMSAIERPVATPVPEKKDDSVNPIIVSKDEIENLTEPSDENEVAQTNDSENTQGVVTAIIKNEDGSITIDLNQAGSSTVVSAVTPKNEYTAATIESNKIPAKPDTIYTGLPGKSAAEVEAEKQAAALNASGAKPQGLAQTSGNRKPNPVNNSVAGVSVSSGKTSVAAAATTVSPSVVETTKYWIQCAAYTSKKSADLARTTLDENRIPAEVFTYKDSKDKLYFRVRVGPYTTKSEAEYWQNRIAKIDSFKSAQSYITQN